MFSALIKSLPWIDLFPNRVLKYSLGFRFCQSSASNQHNIKRFKLIKRLASTVLFGGTFLIVLWAKKRKRLAVFDDAKLVTNSHYHQNFKLYEYKGFILPSFVMKTMDSIHRFKCKEDDIFVVSFPKTGTTWLQEIVYCIMNGVDASSEKTLEDKFPYLEFIYPGLASINKTQGQRFIKTHLPFSLLPEDVHNKSPKILCIMRNPKDVAVSYYHFVRMMTISDYSGDFFNFFQDFLSDKIPYGPLWKHYEEMWSHKDDPNVLLLFYEDLQKDIHGSIKLIGSFLNKEITEAEINEIAVHCSFGHMSENPNTNYQHWDDLGIRKANEAKFMRKGEVGDWKNYLDLKMNNSIDSWINANFKNTAKIFSYSKETLTDLQS